MKRIILTLISLIAVSAYSAYADDTEIQSDTLVICPKCREAYFKTPKYRMISVTDMLGKCANWITHEKVCCEKKYPVFNTKAEMINGVIYGEFREILDIRTDTLYYPLDELLDLIEKGKVTIQQKNNYSK